MKHSIYCFTFIFLFSILATSPDLLAQYIIEEIEYSLPVNYDLLPPDTEFESAEEEALFFLNMPLQKLKADAENSGTEITESISTIFFAGENFAVDNQSEQGKTTVIFDFEKGMLYYVMWEQKSVFTMSKEDMQKIEDETKAVAGRMMNNLPPEMQEQSEEVQETKQQEVRQKPMVKATGKKTNLYGFNCEQYIVEYEEETQLIWAADDTYGLTQRVKNLGEQLNKIFPSDESEESDEWDLVPGKVPVETRIFRPGMMSEPVIEIQSVIKIEKRMPPAAKFVPPGEKDGFTTGSMGDLMQQMMQMFFGEEEQ